MLLNIDVVHLQTLKSGSGAIWAVEVFRDRLLSGDANDTLRHFDMVSGTLVQAINVDDCTIRSIISTSPNIEAVGYKDGTNHVLDIKAGACLRKFTSHQRAVIQLNQ